MPPHHTQPAVKLGPQSEFIFVCVFQGLLLEDYMYISLFLTSLSFFINVEYISGCATQLEGS